MQEIKCPNCGKMFQVDESGYAQIVSQVRDAEFTKELERREKDLAEKKDNDLQIVRLQKEQEQQSALAKKQRAVYP